MGETELDRAHAKMQGSDAGRLSFYAAFADTELFILLEREADGDQIEPRLFPVDGREIVLAFDTEARLAEFVGDVAAYVALPGRIVAQVLGAQGLALGLNLDVAPSAIVLEPDALTWLTETLGGDGPDATQARIRHLRPPKSVPEVLLDALAGRLAQMGGIAQAAILAEVEFDTGAMGHLLAIIGAEPRAEAALARAVNEALTFSGIEAGYLDVVFLTTDAPLLARLARVGIGFDIPQPSAPDIAAPAAPGSDPTKPPRLK